MRILGIDYGRRRIGLAVSDEAAFLARPLDPYLRTRSLQKDLEHLARVAHEFDAETIVIGLPLNMDATKGEMALEVEGFTAQLQELTSARIVVSDERLTSAEAERVLLEGNVKRKDRKLLRDGLAATLILQGYLDSQRFPSEMTFDQHSD
ncbi:MAG: Holliday junction resolvase RuvX [Candidatus Atribacteria bacterium]|jgi:putative Holliday junction resolvase|nr:MAG: Holliday junction resolvase RuvX [Candidatus Atribacteria bacterium]